jgi:hypothetical protein
MLWQRIDLENQLWFYYTCLAFLVLVLAAASVFRRNRSGRVLIAVRENPRAATSYSINLARTKLAAFALSGFISAVAGVLLAYNSHNVDAGSFGADNSVLVFAITVIGGLTSLLGAVVGAIAIQSVIFFQHDIGIGNLALLATGPGLIIVLMFLPGGLAEGLYRLRDNLLRWVADRQGILVPSLVADRRIEPEEAEETIVSQAERHVEEVDTFDVTAARSVACPVCGTVVPMEEAPAHEHFRVEGAPEPVGAGAPATGGGGGAAAGGGGSRRLARARETRR